MCQQKSGLRSSKLKARHKIFSKIWLHESSEGCIHAALKIKDRNDHQDSNVRKCVKIE